MDRRSIIEKKN